MQHDTIELIEQARRRLGELGLPCAIAGGVGEAAVGRAEDELAVSLPPSYRAFLRAFGALTLPPRLGTIRQFIGLDPRARGDADVVSRTEHARREHQLPPALVLVGLGAEPGEWYCLDTSQAAADGECPVLLFDARDNVCDQQFYGDFGQMLAEVVRFVLDTIDEWPDVIEHARAGLRQDPSTTAC